MLRSYHHGHSIIVGALIGLLLDRYVFIVAVIALTLGIILGRAWSFWSDATRTLRAKLLRSKGIPF